MVNTCLPPPSVRTSFFPVSAHSGVYTFFWSHPVPVRLSPALSLLFFLDFFFRFTLSPLFEPFFLCPITAVPFFFFFSQQGHTHARIGLLAFEESESVPLLSFPHSAFLLVPQKDPFFGSTERKPPFSDISLKSYSPHSVYPPHSLFFPGDLPKLVGPPFSSFLFHPSTSPSYPPPSTCPHSPDDGPPLVSARPSF